MTLLKEEYAWTGARPTVNRKLAAVSAFYAHQARNGAGPGDLLAAWRTGSRGGWKPFLTPVRSPRASSFAERHAGTLRRDCPGHLLTCSEQHLRQILAEYSRHYNEHRPHQSREQRPPLHEPGQTIDVTARIKRRQVIQA